MTPGPAGAPLAWVVGSGGLVGRHLVAALRAGGHEVTTSRVPWADEHRSVDVLRRDLDLFAERRDGRPWLVAWCAGAGVVATGADALAAEQRVFERFCALLPEDPDGAGVVVLASSAGGLYAGSGAPPFTEDTAPAPLVAYGRTKLAMEEALAAAVARTGSRAVAARLANVYGPGQTLGKPQGLLSQLCLSDATTRPLPVFVSLDTIRDYVYVADVARMLLRCAELVRDEPAGRLVPKVVASGRPVTVGHLVSEARRVFHRPLRTAMAPGGRGQVLDLRLGSVRWPEVDALASTPLAAGLAATAADVRARVVAGGPLDA
ncbi:NAD-dependent epimerase/dehydratase family protein [Phycicoccus sp. MAQZ13P-2]|uniref:NAD-dependent epimerase/dehydratase family protein n=1 Tax=Phycicoccus mangrovi TaxID=2840470 RepID=UPI001C002F2D|nr:NAD-dependent epimerase/dehydratase family protein [Phycicoccus mangrovi]MBT9255796.1 NAD-dependent epimerase/dehydratase family protein [Phycicoccus mangrovi]MBT9274390.1 NAD-dependent epimerase/dehydratase family protein [Phycicoccus mangrovi]